MEPSNEHTNYVTCPCQHCGGRIKFEADQFRKGETRSVECPHCHLETILFVPITGKELKKSLGNDEQKKSTGFELFLFQLTRIFMLVVAGLLVVVLIVTVLAFILTFQPDKPIKIQSVSYEEIAPVIHPNSNLENTHLSSQNDINTANSLPQRVANFLANNQDVDFKELLTGVELEQRKSFLDNMDAILEKAAGHNLSDSQLKILIEEYASWWKMKNAKKEDAISKYQMRTYYIEGALGTFSILTIFCLILVLLAIERNTRLIAQKFAGSTNLNP